METENDGCDLSECKPSITLVDSCGREFFTNLLPRDMEFLIKYSILMKAKQELAEEALYGPSKKKLRDEKVKLKERKIKVRVSAGILIYSRSIHICDVTRTSSPTNKVAFPFTHQVQIYGPGLNIG